jgi:hypothetical protein
MCRSLIFALKRTIDYATGMLSAFFGSTIGENAPFDFFD